jgi:protein phosphatase
MLLAVADGVGGERGGEVASAEAIRSLESAFDAAVPGTDPSRLLASAVAAANTAILRLAQTDRRYRRMATTLVAAIVRERVMWLANIGDSRAYVIDADSITQLTRDHSLVAEGVEAGSLSPDDARTSGARNIITRSVGSTPGVEADLFGPTQLLLEQTLLLCSDGLSDAVDDILIQDVVLHERRLDQAARALVAAANENGGPDNVSVVLFRAASTRSSGRRPT